MLVHLNARGDVDFTGKCLSFTRSRLNIAAGNKVNATSYDRQPSMKNKADNIDKNIFCDLSESRKK